MLFSTSNYRELTASLPTDFLAQIEPGAENQFFGQQADNVALLSNNGPLYQPFTNNPGTDDSLGPGSFSTQEGINLNALQLDSDPPTFRDDLPLGDSIFGAAPQNENEQLAASLSDLDSSMFYSTKG